MHTCSMFGSVSLTLLWTNLHFICVYSTGSSLVDKLNNTPMALIYAQALSYEFYLCLGQKFLSECRNYRNIALVVSHVSYWKKFTEGIWLIFVKWVTNRC